MIVVHYKLMKYTLEQPNKFKGDKKMKWHKIEIDDNVFEYLKKRAEPFTDTPNSVLRRELFKEPGTTMNTQSNSNAAESGTFAHFQIGAPVALQHILEVVRLVKQGDCGRNEATNFVAKKHRVRPQTVYDQYGRQLGLTADEFDRLLAQPDYKDLVTLLVKKFPSYGDMIRKDLQE